MSESIISDFDDVDSEPETWDESYWIRPLNPRIYPTTDIPPVVGNRKAVLLSLPHEADVLLPPPILPISAFLSDWSYLPTPRQDILPSRVHFSDVPSHPCPHASVRALGLRPTFPPIQVISDLERRLGQAWFKGKVSIEDSHYTTLFLPFWVLTLWRNQNHTFRIRAQWTEAEEVIRSCVYRNPGINLQLRQVADRLTGLFQQVAWCAPVCGFPACGWRPGVAASTSTNVLSDGSVVTLTTSFLQFFKNEFLDDEAINMMLHFIRLRAQRHPTLSATVVIADIHFTDTLLREYSEPDATLSASNLLRRYEELFTDLGRTVLYLVLNAGKDHWAMIKVDFKLCIFSYGDSLAATRAPEKRAISAVTSWLRHAFPGGSEFKMAPNIPCERQRDGWSCGIAACTLISNLLGFDDAWAPETAKLTRLSWASRIMGVHVQTSSNGYTAGDGPVANSEKISEPSSRMAIGSILNDPEPVNPPSPAVSSPNLPNISHLDPDSNDSSVEILESGDASPSQMLLDLSVLGIMDGANSSEPARSPTKWSRASSPKSELESSEAGSIHGGGDCERPLLTVPHVDSRGAFDFSDGDNERNDEPEILLAIQHTSHRKHQRSSSDAIDAHGMAKPAKRPALTTPFNLEKQNYGPVGISRAAALDRASKAAIANGTYKLTEDQRRDLLRRARVHDSNARLDPGDPTGRQIQHSLCGEFIWSSAANRTTKFTRHVKTCKANGGMRKNSKHAKAAANTPKIDSIFKNPVKSAAVTAWSLRSRPTSHALSPSPTSTPPPMVICCGLRPAHDSRLAALMDRGPLGGRMSIHKIAQDRFKKPYKSLTSREKGIVKTSSTATASWIVHYDPQPHVRSARCLQECDPTMTEIKPADICDKCALLLSLREFRNALGRKLPLEENLKFVPYGNRNKYAATLYGRYVGLSELIEQATSTRSPLMNLVTKTLKGELKNADMFLGLVEAMATKDDKLSRGKGLQNFAYKPAFVDFCHAALISSPQTYRLLGKEFPLPAERNLRMRRSRAPGFPIGVSDRTIKRATDYLAKIEYTGPVSISCDDTQLLSKLAPYFDGQNNRWLLLGGVGQPIEIDGDTEDVEKMIEDAVKETERATKCRLWCLQVPTPGVPVFILAAMPISSTLKATDLLVIHNQLVDGLLEAGVCVTSYSCDGSATERKVVTMFLESARETKLALTIPHPRQGFPAIDVILNYFGSRLTPIVAIQDAKHAIKTVRNALYSGVRTMIVGNCPVHYLQVLVLSVHVSSPIYQRDVRKVDRQDDKAPTRLFSSSFLNHILSVAGEQAAGNSFRMTPSIQAINDLPEPHTVLKHDLTGLAVWLFVFGDGFDAFQNRGLAIGLGLHMVLRLKFFLEIWKASLKTLGYSEAQHFLTRDAYIIVNNLIDGYLSLAFIYRDLLDHPNYPYCPWLHSTEGCEHTFGEARKAKPDFTFADFITMIPKLDIMADAAVRTGDYDGNAKARASGYFHTLYATLGVNINAKSTFPLNSSILRIAQKAYEEAEVLLSRCGIVVTPELCPPPPTPEPIIASPSHAGEAFVAPAIQAWFQTEEDEMENDTWGSPDVACDLDEEQISSALELEELLREQEQWGCTTAAQDDQIAAYAAASIALEVEDQRAIEAMPDRDEQEDWVAVQRHLMHIFPPVDIQPLVFADEINYTTLLSSDSEPHLELMPLVSIRQANESRFAKSSVRVGTLKPEVSITTVTDDIIDDNTQISTTFARSILIKKIYATLKSAGEEVVSTAGASRRSRHEGKFETGQTGNSLNATAAAKLRGSKALKARIQGYSPLKCAPLLGIAGVTALSPIQTGSYAFVLVEDQVWFAEVLTMYSKGGGKGGKHGWVNKETNIAAVSNVFVQLWEHWASREFCSMVRKTAFHHARRYAHIQSQRVLYVAATKNGAEIASAERLRLTKSLFGVWEAIQAELPGVMSIVANLVKRTRGVNDEDED